MKKKNVDFDAIISTIRHEFAKVKADEVVKSNMAKLEYLEGFILGLVKLVRTEFESYLERFNK
jgi:hypothetical protein